jgi:hypothetical protein
MNKRDRRDSDRMVVGAITTYAISTSHHYKKHLVLIRLIIFRFYQMYWYSKGMLNIPTE